MSRLAAALAVVVALTAAGASVGGTDAAGARTYYVSVRGSDRAAGTAPARAWRTIARVNRARLRAGARVLSQGGATFRGTLVPRSSGTKRRPIVFGSFGRDRPRIIGRRGAVWLPPGRSHLRFVRLDLTARTDVFSSSGRGAGSVGIRIESSALHDSRGAGVIAPKSSDRDWVVTGNTIARAGDSGIIFLGSGFDIAENEIVDTGGNARITWAKHGIYAKGPNATLRGNRIRNFSASGITLRFRGSRVIGNVVEAGPIGISFFQEDRVQSTSLISRNTLARTSDAGIYVSRGDSGGATRESFVIELNTLMTAGGEGMSIRRTRGSVVLVGNRVEGPHRVTLELDRPEGELRLAGNVWSRADGPPVTRIGGRETAGP